MFSPIAFFSVEDIIITPFSISGGVTSSYTSGPDVYMVHTFNSSTTMTVTGNGSIDYLLIGGGGGGSNGGNFGGGGGAGQQKYITNYNISGGSYIISIGAGGAAQGFGSTTSVDFDSAIGGFRGVILGYNSATWSGVSPQESRWFISGSGSNSTPVGGGGGGGANQDGFNQNANTFPGSMGGYGLTNSITGTAIIRGGGGGGAGPSGYNTGGAGGGGRGGWNSSGQQFGRPGDANTGSGGGGAVNNTGGAGGSGLFILRYKIN